MNKPIPATTIVDVVLENPNLPFREYKLTDALRKRLTDNGCVLSAFDDQRGRAILSVPKHLADLYEALSCG
jgi:hypothetical protein